jgi:hypothetical protein
MDIKGKKAAINQSHAHVNVTYQRASQMESCFAAILRPLFQLTISCFCEQTFDAAVGKHGAAHAI